VRFFSLKFCGRICVRFFIAEFFFDEFLDSVMMKKILKENIIRKNFLKEKRMKETRVLIFSVTILISSVILAGGLSRIAKSDRTVTVRGLCEKEVDADMATWPLTFTLGGNRLQDLQNDIVEKTQIVKNFLSQYNITPDDFTVQPPSITDNSVNPYMNQNLSRYTYLAKTVVLVRSQKIAEVKSAQSNSMELMGKGIAVSNEYGSRISFEFTGLNQIKPEMIADATKNARTAAEQFAHDSGSRVGKIKKATQGLFSIEDTAEDLPEKKTVRVVTTVEYLLK
jgi:hypothetical protein